MTCLKANNGKGGECPAANDPIKCAKLKEGSCLALKETEAGENVDNTFCGNSHALHR